jgi:antirestriction protein ArdC
MSKEKLDVYEIVTDRIIDLLEQGVVPWHKPWAGGSNQLPTNLVSKKAYRGVNVWLLSCSGYASPYWVSYKQATELGGQVRKGEKSTLVVYWKMFENIDKATGEKKTIPMLRYYNVFNVSQCDGISVPDTDTQPKIDFNPIEEAEKIVASMTKLPKITHVEQQAYYNRSTDHVNMPQKETFQGEAEYYSTLFHELTHSTGHESRLGRFQNVVSKFGDSNYAKEELVAEMGASFLCATAGIVERTLDNSAAYIANWLTKLKNDKKLVVSAAGKAHTACDYILGVSA